MCAKPRVQTRLIVADSERSADLLYATRFFAPDPFIFLDRNGKRSIVLSDLEIDRGKRAAQVDEVVAFSDYADRLRPVLKREPLLADVLVAFLKERKVSAALVPEDFPFGLADRLQKEGVRLSAGESLLFAEREYKSDEEVALIGKILRTTEHGIERGFEVLKAAKIGRGGRLLWNNRALTSEILRGEIDASIIREGGLPLNTIVAGGEQACDPHERGSGELRANQLIILDVFPRDARTGYFGDLTRTVVRGSASEEQRKLWDTVLKGQKMALKEMKPGVEGAKLHERIKTFFKDEGYPTERVEGRWQGFFHGTGHGLGLELHEFPRVGRTTLKKGQVFTVEPGLYFPGLGGVRHEDVVLVTEGGTKLLSKLAKPLEL